MFKILRQLSQVFYIPIIASAPFPENSISNNSIISNLFTKKQSKLGKYILIYNLFYFL